MRMAGVARGQTAPCIGYLKSPAASLCCTDRYVAHNDPVHEPSPSPELQFGNGAFGAGTDPRHMHSKAPRWSCANSRPAAAAAVRVQRPLSPPGPWQTPQCRQPGGCGISLSRDMGCHQDQAAVRADAQSVSCSRSRRVSQPLTGGLCKAALLATGCWPTLPCSAAMESLTVMNCERCSRLSRVATMEALRIG